MPAEGGPRPPTPVAHPPVETGWALWIHGVRPVPQLVDIARAAEHHGATALLLADEGVDRDIYVTLAAVAIATHRLLLVPAITNPHSRHPVATSAALASLAELAPGRVVAGLGAGGNLVFDPMALHPARPYTALREAIEVIDDLLAGKTVDHEGQFKTSQAAIAWSPGRLPLAVAGRGPRVERLAAERADWTILAGKVIDDVAEVVARLRARGDGAPSVIWNPSAAWRPEHRDEIRWHFSYMTIDLPVDERRALGISDRQVAQLREAVHRDGPVDAARLVPDQILQRYAIVGSPDQVVRQLADRVARVRPELIAFMAHEYSPAFVAEVADIARSAGLRSAGQ